MKNITEFLKECRVNGNEKIDTNDDSFWKLKDLLEHYKEQCNIHVVSTRSLNELELLAEDLECVKMWLDDKKAPKTNEYGKEYSVIGRIKCLLNVC